MEYGRSICIHSTQILKTFVAGSNTHYDFNVLDALGWTLKSSFSPLENLFCSRLVRHDRNLSSHFELLSQIFVFYFLDAADRKPLFNDDLDFGFSILPRKTLHLEGKGV